MRPLLILALSAAAFGQEQLQVPPPPPPPTPRAVLVEYIEAQAKAWQAMNEARSHREEVIRRDRDGEVRTETETSCPGGTHMRVFHGDKQTTDFYNINGQEYRKVNGAWKESPAPRGTGRCRPAEAIKQTAAMNARMRQQQLQRLDEISMYLHVAKGPVKTVRGIRCQEWRETRIQPADIRMTRNGHHVEDWTSTVCFALDGGYAVERAETNTEYPVVTTTYDWNKPITIKPPQ